VVAPLTESVEHRWSVVNRTHGIHINHSEASSGTLAEYGNGIVEIDQAAG